MNIYFPANIYSALLGLYLPDDIKENIEILPSSMITAKVTEDDESIGLIPTMDLIKSKDLKISKKISLSFDGALSQSYLYFVPEQNKFDKILMRGDVTSNEIILSKILFKERFDLNPELVLDTSDVSIDEQNYLIAGQDNNELLVKHNGVSFADQMAEFLDFPYVNFVLASQQESAIETISNGLEDVDKKIDENIVLLLDKIQLPAEFSKYLSENIDTIYFEMTDNEVEGLHELLKLPFYHGIVDDMIELNLV